MTCIDDPSPYNMLFLLFVVLFLIGFRKSMINNAIVIDQIHPKMYLISRNRQDCSIKSEKKLLYIPNSIVHKYKLVMLRLY